MKSEPGGSGDSPDLRNIDALLLIASVTEFLLVSGIDAIYEKYGRRRIVG